MLEDGAGDHAYRVMQAMIPLPSPPSCSRPGTGPDAQEWGDGLHKYFPGYHKGREVDSKRETHRDAQVTSDPMRVPPGVGKGHVPRTNSPPPQSTITTHATVF
jgi:hypothetical protein